MNQSQQEKLLQGLFWGLWLLFGVTLAFIFVHFQIAHELTLKQFILIYLVWAFIWLSFSLLVLKWRRHPESSDYRLQVFAPKSKNNGQVSHDLTDSSLTTSSGDSP